MQGFVLDDGSGGGGGGSGVVLVSIVSYFSL